jgi:hypothetical protein
MKVVENTAGGAKCTLFMMARFVHIVVLSQDLLMKKNGSFSKGAWGQKTFLFLKIEDELLNKAPGEGFEPSRPLRITSLL